MVEEKKQVKIEDLIWTVQPQPRRLDKLDNQLQDLIKVCKRLGMTKAAYRLRKDIVFLLNAKR